MKMWNRQDGINDVNNADYVLVAIMIFALIGLFTRTPIVFIIIGVLITYFILSHYYNKEVDHLELVNPRLTIRLFPGDVATLPIHLENKSIIPIINGKFSFQLDPAVRVLMKNSGDDQMIKIPLSVIGKRRTALDLSVHGNFRGISKIRNISYTFPHLLNFSSVTLRYTYFYHTEIIVYPELKVVEGIEEVFQMVVGEQRTNFSPYEDVQSLIGTRDYHYGDSFQRINWKSTAKTMQLQTNLYEMVVDMTYVFIVNIANGSKDNIEDLLSYVAFASNYASEKGLPFEIYINARRPGRIPYVYIPEGSNQPHYLYTLEMLARIQTSSLTVPIEAMIHQINLNLSRPMTIILFGHVNEANRSVMNQWEVQGHAVYQLIESGSRATINPLSKGVGQDAN